MVINFGQIEKKWQNKWEKNKIFEVNEKSKKKKYYVLDMFPYPSGAGLHIGHAFVFSLGDIFARFKRMQGLNVIYPIGYDALGLPAENAAIKAKVHPADYTKKSIINFMKQQKAMGWSYDWSRLVNTSDSEFYKWDQWIFLKMLEKGIAYRKKAPVNWCKKCKTVLANEQVVNGCCWRHEDTSVEIKQLEQWFFKITDYAEELLKGLENLDWPENAKKLQRNWIGKSFGTEINFKINNEKWPIFTTRPDTLYGVTFMVISAQHSRLMELVTDEQKKEVENFLKKLKSVSEKDLEAMEKEGVFTGSYAINPINNEKVPVYAGNFVLASYGSGMVMAVPGHDQRDFKFAQKYGLEIKEVIMPEYGKFRKNSERRKSISVVIHRKKDDKFLLLSWKEFNWISPVVGGIEKGESLEKATEREVLEETGCKVKFVKKLGGEVESHFYADNKKVWRSRLDQPVLVELVKEDFCKISKEENDKHSLIWVSSSEALKKITHEYNRAGLLRYLGKEQAYIGSGKLVNSGKFNGINSNDVKEEITKYLAKNKLGKKKIQFKLKDWLISRQRYWGTPIPIVYCDKCGVVPILEKNLPVELPKDVKFGKGNPLLTNEKFMKTKCPKCKGDAKRESDTMDTFANSSWYYLRYCDPKNNKKIFDEKKVNYWCPVDQYIGGPEHITMHLIYTRFYTKFLRDIGLLKFDEPALKYFTQGIIKGKDGEKMSKSRGNVVEPLETIKKYGADSLRLYLISNSSSDSDFDWDDKGIYSSSKFINKVYEYFNNFKSGKSDKIIESKLNKAIKEVTKDVEEFKHNLAVIKIRNLFNSFLDKEIDKKTAESFLKLLHIYCPFITEELYAKIGGKGFISLAEWPVVDEKKIDERLEKAEQIIDNTVSDIMNILKIIKERGDKSNNIYVYVMPFEKQSFDEEKISLRVGKPVKVFAVNDKDKYDPKQISKKSKPGRPGIFVE
jgi:leucyl-tRNA synthetase